MYLEAKQTLLLLPRRSGRGGLLVELAATSLLQDPTANLLVAHTFQLLKDKLKYMYIITFFKKVKDECSTLRIGNLSHTLEVCPEVLLLAPAVVLIV